jgi:hypothetical protein
MSANGRGLHELIPETIEDEMRCLRTPLAASGRISATLRDL